MHVCTMRDTTIQCLEIVAQCLECGEPATFIGLNPGPSPDVPSMTPCGVHAFLPFQVQSDRVLQ